ncbi:MAG: 2,3-diketo-5-methylthio-1-phosphopentane phosphatase [Dehalococcoidia bacterium]|nr:MAG: 2,3-diketo-5-methylthio-1-phosphopentane phosphatase [Dehalococcoidia bacterium]
MSYTRLRPKLGRCEAVKTLIQCDFDGTITQEDVSFLILDAFASRDWRQLLTEYREGKISVGYFNTKAFAMVKADKQTLLKFVKSRAKIRAGFHELLAYCHRRGFQFVIVSNGLDFYIKTILRDIGIDNIEVFSAQTQFGPNGVNVQYIGPEGNQLEDSFKEAYVRLFRERGYRLIYAGNGVSDISPARQAHHIFATGELLTYCKDMNLNCMPFIDLNDIIRGLEFL